MTRLPPQDGANVVFTAAGRLGMQLALLACQVNRSGSEEEKLQPATTKLFHRQLHPTTRLSFPEARKPASESPKATYESTHNAKQSFVSYPALDAYSMATPGDIIDWHEAMQQCGDDEEFLRELLADLRSETETQVISIEAIIQNPQDAPFHRIMRSAHVIKGASANLMCQQLRMAALQLETSARECHEAGGTASPPGMQQLVHQRFLELQQAANNFAQYLQSIGI